MQQLTLTCSMSLALSADSLWMTLLWSSISAFACKLTSRAAEEREGESGTEREGGRGGEGEGEGGREGKERVGGEERERGSSHSLY